MPCNDVYKLWDRVCVTRQVMENFWCRHEYY